MTKLLSTNAPAATVVIRALVGVVFLLEGIKKFLFVAQWGPAGLPELESLRRR
jgi:hypothetical protein